MKKLIALLIVVIITVVPAMTSCSSEGGQAPSSGQGNTSSGDSESAQKPSDSSKSAGNNYLNAVFTEDPETCDVQKTTVYYAVPLNIYNRLIECITVDGEATLVPNLAESWEVSDDSMVYTFHLRKGVKFHNGEELKADDVLFTIERMMDPKELTRNTNFFDMIKGAKDKFEGLKDHVEGVKIIDDYTVEITLEIPFAPFLANLATPSCSIYNRKATEEAGSDFGILPEKTVGTGPFRMSKWALNDEIVLDTFDDYWEGASTLDGIRFKIIPDEETQRMMFETGEIDIFDVSNAPSQLDYFKNNPQWQDKIKSGMEAGVYFYTFNQNIEPLDNVSVRKAIQMGVDRQLLLESFFNGEGQVTNNMVVEGSMGYNSDMPNIEYNPQKARQLLAEAGYPDGFDMTIMQGTDSPNELRMNEAIQSMLGEIGIRVNIEQVDDATYYSTRTAGEIPSERMVWWIDYNDPDNYLYTFFSERNNHIMSLNYANPEVISSLETARSMTDHEERMKLYQKIEKIIIHDDAAILPLFQLNHPYILQDGIENFKLSWNGWTDMNYYGINKVK